MPRKKTPEYAAIRVRSSFNGMRKGDTATVELDERVQGWVRAGLVEVTGHGTDQAGPGGAEPDDYERVPEGAEGGEQAGGEPGQDFGSGAYGSPA